VRFGISFSGLRRPLKASCRIFASGAEVRDKLGHPSVNLGHLGSTSDDTNSEKVARETTGAEFSNDIGPTLRRPEVVQEATRAAGARFLNERPV
jgi:hypothetical protein